MTRLIVLSAIVTLMTCTAAMPAGAQERCDHPTTNEWLRASPPADWRGITTVEVSPVLEVEHEIASAVAKLEDVDAIPLTPDEMRQFTGEPAGDPPSGTRPYLVRAVYPTSWPTLHVSWYGNELYVFAGGLGCAPFVKRPIIVYLDRPPHTVFTSARSAL